MPTTMILHDRRLLGYTPRGYGFAYVGDGSVMLADALNMVRANGRHRRIDPLHTFCHGRTAREDHGLGIATSERHGGFGLELWHDHPALRNVARTQTWRGMVGQIVLFVCSAAQTAGSNDCTIGDGRRFCGERAPCTQADVIAARDAQQYARVEDTFWNATSRASRRSTSAPGRGRSIASRRRSRRARLSAPGRTIRLPRACSRPRGPGRAREDRQ